MPLQCSLVSHMGNMVMTRSFTTSVPPRSKDELRVLLMKQDLRLHEMPFTYTGKLPPYGEPVEFSSDKEVVDFFFKSHNTVIFDVFIEGGNAPDVRQQLNLFDSDLVMLHMYPVQVDKHSDVIEREFFIPETGICAAIVRTVKRCAEPIDRVNSQLSPMKGFGSTDFSSGMNLEVSIILKRNEKLPLDNDDATMKELLRQYARSQTPVRIAYAWKEVAQCEVSFCNVQPSDRKVEVKENTNDGGANRSSLCHSSIARDTAAPSPLTVSAISLPISSTKKSSLNLGSAKRKIAQNSSNPSPAKMSEERQETRTFSLFKEDALKENVSNESSALFSEEMARPPSIPHASDSTANKRRTTLHSTEHSRPSTASSPKIMPTEALGQSAPFICEAVAGREGEVDQVKQQERDVPVEKNRKIREGNPPLSPRTLSTSTENTKTNKSGIFSHSSHAAPLFSSVTSSTTSFSPTHSTVGGSRERSSNGVHKNVASTPRCSIPHSTMEIRQSFSSRIATPATPNASDSIHSTSVHEKTDPHPTPAKSPTPPLSISTLSAKQHHSPSLSSSPSSSPPCAMEMPTSTNEERKASIVSRHASLTSLNPLPISIPPLPSTLVSSLLRGDKVKRREEPPPPLSSPPVERPLPPPRNILSSSPSVPLPSTVPPPTIVHPFPVSFSPVSSPFPVFTDHPPSMPPPVRAEATTTAFATRNAIVPPPPSLSRKEEEEEPRRVTPTTPLAPIPSFSSSTPPSVGAEEPVAFIFPPSRSSARPLLSSPPRSIRRKPSSSTPSCTNRPHPSSTSIRCSNGLLLSSTSGPSCHSSLTSEAGDPPPFTAGSTGTTPPSSSSLPLHPLPSPPSTPVAPSSFSPTIPWRSPRTPRVGGAPAASSPLPPPTLLRSLSDSTGLPRSFSRSTVFSPSSTRPSGALLPVSHGPSLSAQAGSGVLLSSTPAATHRNDGGGGLQGVVCPSARGEDLHGNGCTSAEKKRSPYGDSGDAHVCGATDCESSESGGTPEWTSLSPTPPPSHGLPHPTTTTTFSAQWSKGVFSGTCRPTEGGSSANVVPLTHAFGQEKKEMEGGAHAVPVLHHGAEPQWWDEKEKRTLPLPLEEGTDAVDTNRHESEAKPPITNPLPWAETEGPTAMRRSERWETSSPTQRLISVAVLLFVDDSTASVSSRTTPFSHAFRSASTASTVIHTHHTTSATANAPAASFSPTLPTEGRRTSSHPKSHESNSSTSALHNSHNSSFFGRFSVFSKEFTFLKGSLHLLQQFKKWCGEEKGLFPSPPLWENISTEVVVGTSLHAIQNDHDLTEWVALSREAQRPLRIRLTLSSECMSSPAKPLSSCSSSLSFPLGSPRESHNNSFCHSLVGTLQASSGIPIVTVNPTEGGGLSSPPVVQSTREAEEPPHHRNAMQNASFSRINVHQEEGEECGRHSATMVSGGPANSPTLFLPPSSSSPLSLSGRKMFASNASSGLESNHVLTSGSSAPGISSSLSSTTPSSNATSSSPSLNSFFPHSTGGGMMGGGVLPPLKNGSSPYGPECSLSNGGGGAPLGGGGGSYLGSRTPSSTPRSSASTMNAAHPLPPPPLPSALPPPQVYPTTPVIALPPRNCLPLPSNENTPGRTTTTTTTTASSSGKDGGGLRSTVKGEKANEEEGRLRSPSPSLSLEPLQVDTQRRPSPNEEAASSVVCHTLHKKPTIVYSGKTSTPTPCSFSSTLAMPPKGVLPLPSDDENDTKKRNTASKRETVSGTLTDYFLGPPSLPPVICTVSSTGEILAQCVVRWESRESLILCRLHKDFMVSDLKRASCYEFSVPPGTDSSTLSLAYTKITDDKKTKNRTIRKGVVHSDDQLYHLMTQCVLSSITWEVCANASAFGTSSIQGEGAKLDREIVLVAAEVVDQVGTSFCLRDLEKMFMPAKKYFQNLSQIRFFDTLHTLAREEKGGITQTFTVKDVEDLLCRCFASVQKDREARDVCCTFLTLLTFCTSRKQALERFFRSVYRNMQRTKGAVPLLPLREILNGSHKPLPTSSLHGSSSSINGASHAKDSVVEENHAVSESEFLDACLSIFEVGPPQGGTSSSFLGDEEKQRSVSPRSVPEKDRTGARASQLLNAFAIATMEGTIRRSNFSDFPASHRAEAERWHSSAGSSPSLFCPSPDSASRRNGEGKGSLVCSESLSSLSSSAVWARVYCEKMKEVLLNRCSPAEMEHFCWSAVEPGADSRELVILSIIGALLAPSREPLPPLLDHTDSRVRSRSSRLSTSSSSSSIIATVSSINTANVEFCPNYYVDFILERCKGKSTEALYARMMCYGSGFEEEGKLEILPSTPHAPSAQLSSSLACSRTAENLSLTGRSTSTFGVANNSSLGVSPSFLCLPKTPTSSGSITGGNRLPLKVLHHIVWALLSPSLDLSKVENEISQAAAALVEWSFAAVQLVCVVQKQLFPVMPPFQSKYVSLPLRPIAHDPKERASD